MILYIVIAAITIGLAYVVRTCRAVPEKEYLSRGRLLAGSSLFAIFCILFLLSAFRLNVGNDYGKYVEFMHRLYTSQYIADPGVPTEWGFNLLAMIVYKLSGFENYLLVFAIYAFATVLIFLLAMYEQSVDFGLTFLMYMCLGYYYQSFSTVRYYLALGIALYAMKYVQKHQWVRFLIWIFIGSAFHKSILVVVPLYILCTIAWKKWQATLIVLLFSTGLFLQELYLKIVVILYPTYEDTEYLDAGGLSYINILRCSAVLFLSVLLYKSAIAGKKQMEFYFYLNLTALLLYLCCSFLPFVSRIGYYLTVSHMLFLPALVESLTPGKKKRLLRCALIAAMLLYFVMYLAKASQDGVLVLPYKTFFFHNMVDILSDVA